MSEPSNFCKLSSSSQPMKENIVVYQKRPNIIEPVRRRRRRERTNNNHNELPDPEYQPKYIEYLKNYGHSKVGFKKKNSAVFYQTNSPDNLNKEESVLFFNLCEEPNQPSVLNSLSIKNNSSKSQAADQRPDLRSLRKDSMMARSLKISKKEQDLFNSDSQCIICVDAKADVIYSPCNHGGVCFECAKRNLAKKNSCYYCRKVDSS